MINKKNNFVIGVDGGGTKTDAWVFNLNGKIVSKAKGGPSNLRNVGIEKTVDVVSETIYLAFSKKKIKGDLKCIFIGLAAFPEEFRKEEDKIKNGIKNNKKIKSILKGDVFIDGDQIVAFRSGTDKKEGIVAIAGTGCSVRGWKNKKTFKSNGWGWLTDEGSSFWVGQKACEIFLKSLDKRKKQTILSRLISKNLKVKSPEAFNKKIYNKDVIKNVSTLSLIVDQASFKKDKEALDILDQAGKEIALSVISVSKELKLKNDFPLVLVGGMFKSKHLFNSLKREIKKEKINPRFIFPKKEPVYGAIKLAIEKHEKKS